MPQQLHCDVVVVALVIVVVATADTLHSTVPSCPVLPHLKLARPLPCHPASALTAPPLPSISVTHMPLASLVFCNCGSIPIEKWCYAPVVSLSPAYDNYETTTQAPNEKESGRGLNENSKGMLLIQILFTDS